MEERENMFGITEEDLNANMEYELNEVRESGILDYGIQIDIKDSNYTHWIVTIEAPNDSDYNGGKYKLSIDFDVNYPYSPPKINFITPIYHCNVNENGELKVNWLMRGLKIEYIIPRLLTLFYIQDTTGIENYDKCNLYINKNEEFKEKIKKNVEQSQRQFEK